MKVQHIHTGQVVEVPPDKMYLTIDKPDYDPELTQREIPPHQPTPYFQWAIWKPVADDTPITNGPDGPEVAKGKTK